MGFTGFIGFIFNFTLEFYLDLFAVNSTVSTVSLINDRII